MTQKKRLPKEQLKRLLIDNSMLDAIKQGRYREVIEHNVPARAVPRGKSLIISYYQGCQYICTKHELKTETGDTVHQDVEAVLIGGTRYVRLEQ